MKKLNILLLLLLGGFVFTACVDEVGPTINKEAEDGTLAFQLFNPVYANSVYQLTEANSSGVVDTLYCNEPAYGFTAPVTYTVQVSLNSNFTDSVYFEDLATLVQGEKVPVNVKELNTALNTLYGNNFPTPAIATKVYVRLKAVISDVTTTITGDKLLIKPAYSNAIEIRVLPYKAANLKYYYQVTVKPYYIIGLANGAWDNSDAGLGVSMYPLSVVKEAAYDENGNGTFKFTGYFSASRSFKLIRDIGSWNEQWGNKSAEGINNPINKAIAGEEPSNLKVPEDGYYTITLNSIKNTLTVEKTTETPPTYASVALMGTFNGWGADVAMTPAEATNNHIWFITHTFAEAGQYKFRANASWDVANWGTPAANDGDSQYALIGVGGMGGKNLPSTAGTYRIILNDQDGCYYVIK